MRNWLISSHSEHSYVNYCSFATGIEFRESSMMIGPKCTATAKAGWYSCESYSPYY